MHLKVSPACSRFVNCQYTQKPPSLSWLSEVTMAKSAFVTRRVPASSHIASANVQTQVSYAADRVNPNFDLAQHIELLKQCPAGIAPSIPLPEDTNTTHEMEEDVEEDIDFNDIMEDNTEPITELHQDCTTNNHRNVVSYSSDQRHMVELLNLLDSMGCPDDSISKILSWA